MLSPKDLLTHIPLLLFPILILIIIGIVVFVLMRLLHLPSEWKGGELPTVTSVVRRQILTATKWPSFGVCTQRLASNIPAARAYAVSSLRQQLGLLDDQSGTRQTAASF